jgi:hypothetical protein
MKIRIRFLRHWKYPYRGDSYEPGVPGTRLDLWTRPKYSYVSPYGPDGTCHGRDTLRVRDRGDLGIQRGPNWQVVLRETLYHDAPPPTRRFRLSQGSDRRAGLELLFPEATDSVCLPGAGAT